MNVYEKVDKRLSEESALTPTHHRMINQCVESFNKGTGKKVKYLHLDGLDYKLQENKSLKGFYDIEVSVERKVLHKEQAIHLYNLFDTICAIANDEVKYNCA